ncbi:hypothetical protein WIS52_28695 [Pseudonocardia nematodicida]|uniref:Uncharacterized protein n=1 Tax=Pseudonocardia nematodicida TaxID=1206997 RepID=A0ABV1KKJ1_9PSEU
MRLGRKLSEGFVTDHEADRMVAAPDRPAEDREPEHAELPTTGREQPARSGSRED